MDEGGDSRLLKGASTDDPIGGGDEKGQIKNKEVQFLFSHERDQFPNKAYHEDGNPDMYSKENIDRRRMLMRNDVVVDAINDFMGEFKKNS